MEKTYNAIVAAANEALNQEEIIQRYQAKLQQYQLNATSGQVELPTLLKNNNYVLFPRQYYSGSDIFISLGNIPVDEIIEIEFSMVQGVQPVYGYASYTWDAVMYGNRYVTGSFKINFKETFYIKSILDSLQGQSEISLQSAVNSGKKANSDATINEIQDRLRGRSVTDATKILEAVSQEDIKKLAEALESQLWNSSEETDKKYQSAYLNPFSEFDYLSIDSAWNSNYNKLMKNGFDIFIGFGEEITNLVGKTDKAQGTLKVINGVHLTGYRTVYQPTGQPIYEEYSFIARDIDSNVTL